MNREPKFRGYGIFMPMQPIDNLVKGDTCWDADLGELTWNGNEWINLKLKQNEKQSF